MTIPATYITTRAAAALFGVDIQTLQSAHKMHGHYKSVVPRKLPNGRLAWPVLEIYKAIGKLSSAPRHDPATKLRELVCATVPDLDPFQAQRFSEVLFTDEQRGNTVAERLETALLSLSLLVALIDAQAERTRSLMKDESQLSADTLRRLNHFAEDLSTATENLSQPLLWRRPAQADNTCGMFNMSKPLRDVSRGVQS